jgi:hypothetical protein
MLVLSEHLAANGGKGTRRPLLGGINRAARACGRTNPICPFFAHLHAKESPIIQTSIISEPSARNLLNRKYGEIHPQFYSLSARCPIEKGPTTQPHLECHIEFHELRSGSYLSLRFCLWPRSSSMREIGFFGQHVRDWQWRTALRVGIAGWEPGRSRTDDL